MLSELYDRVGTLCAAYDEAAVKSLAQINDAHNAIAELCYAVNLPCSPQDVTDALVSQSWTTLLEMAMYQISQMTDEQIMALPDLPKKEQPVLLPPPAPADKPRVTVSIDAVKNGFVYNLNREFMIQFKEHLRHLGYAVQDFHRVLLYVDRERGDLIYIVSSLEDKSNDYFVRFGARQFVQDFEHGHKSPAYIMPSNNTIRFVKRSLKRLGIVKPPTTP